MRKIPLLAAIVLSVAVGAPRFAAAIETNGPAPPSPQQSTQPSGTTTTKHKTKKEKTGSAEKFLNDWHKAYALVYDKGDASRKLGRYDDAKYWYDKALAADPNHALTWSYYGMWQAEQGNLLKAKDDLEKVHMICGNTDCREYVALKEVIDGTRTY
jgi:tetratricopeptide (TPR) repeat protein